MSADNREHAFGQGGSGLDRCHGYQEQAYREQGRGKAAGVVIHCVASSEVRNESSV
ncbi:hypothetical protein EMIT0194MI4_60002 [Pseudomonas sp. IT-194MI4]